LSSLRFFPPVRDGKRFEQPAGRRVDTIAMSNEDLPMRFVVPSIVVALMAVAGCTRDNPASCGDNHCADPALPFCDVDGAIGGQAGTCIAVSCTPREFEACRDDRALMCSASGDNYDIVECEFGCNPIAGCNTCNTSDCEKHIIPKYVPTICGQLASSSALTISSNTTLDTSDASACTSVVPQASGPEICVMHYGTITIERNQTYTVKGSRALALVADYALTVDGVLDVSAYTFTNGPGGGTVASGTGVNVAGGGAGYRTVGGAGASDTVDGGAANGGAARTNPALLAELFGGPRPDPGATSGPGGGGGAATLISCRGTTSVSGLIDAGGGGGPGGSLTNTFEYRYPGGGGAGGTVVLQGLNVSVTGEIYANGGGGGAGGAPGDFGVDGLRSTAAAPGGIGDSGAGNGGPGGTETVPQHGKKPATSGGFTGAGGASAGFILVYTPQGIVPTRTPIAISPGFEATGTIATNR
jgi:hypothetical protein